MTTYRGPNAFSSGILKPAKKPLLVPKPLPKTTLIKRSDGPAAFDIRSKNRGGGQSEPNIIQGGGGGDYVAKAVHFDGSAILSIASLVATDNLSFAMSMWAKFRAPFKNYGSVWVLDPLNEYEACSAFLATEPPHQWFVDLNNGTAVEVAGPNFPAEEVWLNMLVSIVTDASDPDLSVAKYYLNDVDVTNFSTDTGVNLWNGKPFYFGDDSFDEGAVMDVADVWIAPGVSLLTDGDIPEATRRLFISASGKPVNPSGFPASAILFSGDEDTFATNQGTGGASTLTGTITNASTSPSD